MVTKVGGQILATKFGFVPDCWVEKRQVVQTKDKGTSMDNTVIINTIWNTDSQQCWHKSFIYILKWLNFVNKRLQ